MYPRISWSSLKKYEECPQKLKLHREKKRKPIKEAWVLRGNTMHYSLEQLIYGRSAEEVMESALRDHDRQVDEAFNLGWGPEEIGESLAKISLGTERLIELFAELKKRHPNLISEMRLFKFYPTWALEGILDAYAPVTATKPGAIIDLKSGSWEHGQMVFYQVLHQAYFGRKVNELLIVEPLGRGIVDVVVTDEEMDEMRERIKVAVVAMARNDFPTTGFPDKCNWCQSAQWCPAMEKTRAGRLA